jgi:hypothetical protein
MADVIFCVDLTLLIRTRRSLRLGMSGGQALAVIT